MQVQTLLFVLKTVRLHFNGGVSTKVKKFSQNDSTLNFAEEVTE